MRNRILVPIEEKVFANSNMIATFRSRRWVKINHFSMGKKSNNLQVSSQKMENRRMRTRLLIPLISPFVPRTYWTILWVPCVHRSQALKLFPGKNHCFWFKFYSVCIYEGRKIIDCQGRLQVVKSILTDGVFLMLSNTAGDKMISFVCRTWQHSVKKQQLLLDLGNRHSRI